MMLPHKAAILDAAPIAMALREELASGHPLKIDASAVESIHVSVLQLICAALRESVDARMANPSQGFIAAVHRCGLERILLHGQWEVA